MYRACRGVAHAKPPKKRPYRIDTGLKWMFLAQFFKASSLKKKLERSLIVWVLGSAENNA